MMLKPSVTYYIIINESGILDPSLPPQAFTRNEVKQLPAGKNLILMPIVRDPKQEHYKSLKELLRAKYLKRGYNIPTLRPKPDVEKFLSNFDWEMNNLNGIDIIRIKKGSYIYKAVNVDMDPEKEKEFIIQKNIKLNYFSSCEFAQEYMLYLKDSNQNPTGRINKYVFTRDVNLVILNYNNVKNFYDVSNTSKEITSQLVETIRIVYGVDVQYPITRLMAMWQREYQKRKKDVKKLNKLLSTPWEIKTSGDWDDISENQKYISMVYEDLISMAPYDKICLQYFQRIIGNSIDGFMGLPANTMFGMETTTWGEIVLADQLSCLLRTK